VSFAGVRVTTEESCAGFCGDAGRLPSPKSTVEFAINLREMHSAQRAVPTVRRQSKRSGVDDELVVRDLLLATDDRQRGGWQLRPIGWEASKTRSTPERGRRASIAGFLHDEYEVERQLTAMRAADGARPSRVCVDTFVGSNPFIERIP
jgi:hypothetical protein